jgi:hypothetical protein
MNSTADVTEMPSVMQETKAEDEHTHSLHIVLPQGLLALH